MGRRWLWLGLVVLLVAGSVAAGWLLYGWDVTPPAPSTIETRPEARVSGAIEVKKFEVTMAIPPAPPAPSQTDGAEPPEGPKVSRPIPPPSAPITTAEVGLSATKPSSGESPVMESLTKPIKVQGIVIPPPGVVPPFARDEKPVFILETERQGRVVTVRGTTNLAVEGNGVQVSLFRLFTEKGAEENRRADMDRRNVSLWFEGRFPVDDADWLKARLDQARAHPEVFPAVASVDKSRVFVEVLFTAKRAEVGPVPGLSVHPIPGTDKQVYRIVRPIQMPLDREAEVILARATGQAPPPPAEPAAKAPPPKPVETAKPALPKKRGRTRIIIKPLKWLDGPRVG